MCNVSCIPEVGNYICSSEGKNECLENWSGYNCDSCSEHRTGDTCTECVKGWAGKHCQECADNYYPSNMCNVSCISVYGRYSCSEEGAKECYDKWKGVECDSCAEHRTGDSCNECIEGWGGDKCQQCAENYYPAGMCNVTCISVDGRYSCSGQGVKVCNENMTGVECDSCAEHRTGDSCDECIYKRLGRRKMSGLYRELLPSRFL